jgi:DNA-binding SARP family transcriptional activator/tetratricopeptide (TPR) repeat protein
VQSAGVIVQVRLLGPVDVVLDGETRSVSGLRRKAVLAALALHEGQVVSTGQLVDAVWGESAPATVVNSLQAHISYLRGVLGSRDAILTRAPGYRLNLGGDGTDALAAERLLAQGRRAANPAQGAKDLHQALALWRGRPLADVTGSAWLEEQAARLDLLADEVRRALLEARLAAGEHAEIVPGLEQMAAAGPLDEQVHGQLMLALYRCGRQADALAVFGRLRAALAEQLGIDPGPELRELQTAILRHDEALAGAARSPVSLGAQRVPVPAQLPPAVPGFAGRGAELARLDAMLARAQREPLGGPAAVVISAVSGTAGVGKTALAVQWAHRVAARFPDGQLYVNLRGFGPGGQPAEPAEAVRGFLAGLGVAPAQIPHEVPAQVALYRSLLAGKRVLVVLDNARDPSQVRPLLPGSPGCLTIVTSRSDLAGLVAAEGACPVSLDLLSPAEAGELLARRLGEARVTREPAAVSEIIERCARLPLALSIAAARAAARPGFPLAVIAAGLRGAATLDPFGGTDLATDVRAVFSWSRRLLSEDAARLFALLGLHPGPDISVRAAASLATVPPGRAEALLAELAEAHLLSEHRPDRYTAHDLLRAYAAEQAQSLVPDDARVASHRMFGHYLHTAYTAARLLKPERDPIDLAEAAPGTMAEDLTTPDSALAWFTAEHHVLLACISASAAAGLDRHAWQLAWTMKTYLFRRGYWHEQVMTERAAADAAGRDGDLRGRATALFSLAEACERLNRADEAESHYREALEAFAAAGDLSGEADTCIGLAGLADQQHRPADALRYARRALDTFRLAGDPIGQALALSGVGWSHALLGEYHQALAFCQDALALMPELGLREGEAGTWNSLGYAHQGLADYRQAAICYQRALGLYRELGDRYYEATALNSLGDVRLSAGDSGAARRAWAQALAILEELDHADASRVRAKLTSQVSPGQAGARPIAATTGNSVAHAPGSAASPDPEPSRV